MHQRATDIAGVGVWFLDCTTAWAIMAPFGIRK